MSSDHQNIPHELPHAPASPTVQVVQVQPGYAMHINPNLPSVLQSVALLDKLVLKRMVGTRGAEYFVEKENGDRLFYALEDPDESMCCARSCYGSTRSFELIIMDQHMHELIHVSRPSRSFGYCCTMENVTVFSPPGTIIGYIIQEISFYQSFRIEDDSHETILRIKKHPFPQFICQKIKHNVLSRDGKVQVGEITKSWNGFLSELGRDYKFEISFPADMDVKIKTLLLASSFILSVMYYRG